MKPRIDSTKFGSITIAGEVFEHDVFISLNGKVHKRKKKLSKDVFGTSHIVSQVEAEHVNEDGAECLIFETGQSGMAKLSDEAAEFLKKKSCRVKLLPMPEAIQVWNAAEEL